MNKIPEQHIAHDPWTGLKQFTSARIALGHTGNSLTTRTCLEFQLAHALARDAVHIPIDFSGLERRLSEEGYRTLIIKTQAENQAMYLQRPDLGRLLASGALAKLENDASVDTDAVIIVADGLSSKAIENHAEPFLRLLLPALKAKNYRLSPLCLVKHGRVAIGDAIADVYQARLCIVLIGERPGLSSPDSMGIYFTYQARAGQTTDADRNCISNIHNQGLGYQEALKKLMFLIDEAEKLQYSGVNLKDQTTETLLNEQKSPVNFLLE